MRRVPRAWGIALGVLALSAALGLLYLGRSILVPVTLAVLLCFAISPLVLKLRVFGLGRRQAVGDQGQAARAREGAQLGVIEACGVQALARHAFQIARGGGLHAGGDFFGEQFEEQLGHAARSPSGI